jgi:hypothetical protein
MAQLTAEQGDSVEALTELERTHADPGELRKSPQESKLGTRIGNQIPDRRTQPTSRNRKSREKIPKLADRKSSRKRALTGAKTRTQPAAV